MPPHAGRNDQHEEEARNEKQRIGFPNPLHQCAPTCQSSGKSSNDEQGYERDTRKEYRIVQEIGPESGVKLIIHKEGDDKAQQAQYHTTAQYPSFFCVEYELIHCSNRIKVSFE